MFCLSFDVYVCLWVLVCDGVLLFLFRFGFIGCVWACLLVFCFLNWYSVLGWGLRLSFLLDGLLAFIICGEFCWFYVVFFNCFSFVCIWLRDLFDCVYGFAFNLVGSLFCLQTWMFVLLGLIWFGCLLIFCADFVVLLIGCGCVTLLVIHCCLFCVLFVFEFGCLMGLWCVFWFVFNLGLGLIVLPKWFRFVFFAVY